MKEVSKYLVGVDIGGTTIKTGVVNTQGEMLSKSVIDTNPGLGYQVVLDNICTQINEVCKSANISLKDTNGVGIGTPGIVDSNGTLLYSNNLGWNHAPISKFVSEKLGVTVDVANDANAAALGEAVFGIGKDYKDVLLLTVGTGIGGGVVCDNKLLIGGNGIGMELGHHTIIKGGNVCSCGLDGCFEAYCTAIYLINHVKATLGRSMTLLEIWQNYNDVELKPLLDEYVSNFATGTINMINIFRPQVVAIGGGISHTGDLFLNLLQKAVGERYYGAKLSDPIQFAYASLKNDAGIYGAASLRS